MKEFIEELKHNQEINNKSGLENRVDIDYVIDRLENINRFLVNELDYFKYHNKNLTYAQEFRLSDIYDNLTDKGVFKDE